MTNQQHPITPPPELVEQWHDAWIDAKVKHDGLIDFLAAQAAQWGADQELEACCEWLKNAVASPAWVKELRAARRPKPPSLNSIALQMLGTIERDAHYIPEITDTIRRALEALDD